MNPAKVLEVSGYPPPFGGWTMRTAQVKARLEQEGHTCIVLNIGDNRRVPSPHYETVDGAWDFVRKLWKFCRRGFLVHTHANGESPKGILLAIVAHAVARWSGQPCVLTFHAGVDQLYFPRSRAPRWMPVFRLLFAMPRRIICNSDEVRRLIADYDVPLDRIDVIPAFSRQYVQFTPATLPDALERHFERWPVSVFSYLTLRRTFDPEILVEAFAQLAAGRNIGLVVCGLDGHTDPDVATSFHRRIASSGYADRICLVGSLTHDAFLTAMTRCRVYVRTPVSDGVCSSVLEALTLGVPVVASENQTRPEGVITFPAGDAKRLAEAVIPILDHEARRRVSPAGDVPDTVGVEVDVLIGQEPRAVAAGRVAV